MRPWKELAHLLLDTRGHVDGGIYRRPLPTAGIVCKLHPLDLVLTTEKF